MSDKPSVQAVTVLVTGFEVSKSLRVMTPFPGLPFVQRRVSSLHCALFSRQENSVRDEMTADTAL